MDSQVPPVGDPSLRLVTLPCYDVTYLDILRGNLLPGFLVMCHVVISREL